MERRTFCRMCNVACGAIVRLEGDRVVDVRGDRDHPVSRGYLCPKGRASGAFHHHRDRLDYPALGRGDDRRRGTWDAVLNDLATRIQGAVRAAGPSTAGMYKGTAHYLESAAAGLGKDLLDGIGSKSWYTSLTVDCPAVTLVAELVVGDPWLLPVPDVDARLTVVVGTNPMASHGHTFNVPRPKEQLREWARNGELWVVDPRRTATAEMATVHLAPRPGTDYLLFAHLVRELLRDGADRAYLEQHASGVGALVRAVAPFTAERVAGATGIDARRIAALLARIRDSGRVAVVTGTGLNFARSANLAVWMAWMVSAVTGSLDRPGGMWFNPGYLSRTDLHPRPVLEGGTTAGPASRPGLSGRFGELPCAAVVDEIEGGHLRALVVLGGNPLIAWPQPERVARALRRLDVLAVLDVVENEVTELATHVLPVTGQLERADVPTGAELYGMRSFSQYTEAVVAAGAERRPAWWVLGQLGRRLGVQLLDVADPDETTEADVLRSRYGADDARWRELREAPSGVLSPDRPYGWVHDRLPGQRVRLAPQILVEQLAATVDPPPAGLMLIPQRLLTKTNSQLADGHGLREPARAAAMLHPADAARLGVANGDEVTIVSVHGALRIEARVDERAAAGTVSVPHGFAHANVAGLISGDDVDPLTGMPQMTGLSVTVRAAPPA